MRHLPTYGGSQWPYIDYSGKVTAFSAIIVHIAFIIRCKHLLGRYGGIESNL